VKVNISLNIPSWKNQMAAAFGAWKLYPIAGFLFVASMLWAADRDLNRDGVINARDLQIVTSCYGKSVSLSPKCAAADLNGNGFVDDSDVAAIRTSLGQLAAVSNTELADRLATTLLGAQNSSDRYAAMAACLQAIGIGIYAPDGQVVQAGVERGSGDFYVYDFEVSLLAMMSHADDFRDYSHVINSLNLPSALNQFNSPAAFNQALTLSLEDALADPDAPSSFNLLLIRSLGLQAFAPFDLAAGAPADSIKLTPLQHWLILADAWLPLISAAPVVLPESYQISLGGACPSSACYQKQYLAIVTAG
jgi:hypothetical protein